MAVQVTNGEPCAPGVSRYYLDPETGAAEFAVAVGDPWQGLAMSLALGDSRTWFTSGAIFRLPTGEARSGSESLYPGVNRRQ